MNCNEVQALLDAYVDNELDLVMALEIKQHLHTCAVCSSIYQNRVTLQTALSGNILYFHTPTPVRKRLLASLDKASGQTPSALPVKRLRPESWLALVSGMVAVFLMGWGLSRVLPSAASTGMEDVIAQEVLSSHIRSLMASHLTDVDSTDQHTVRPWFDGKLDFIPPVVDLVAQDFPLIGGRLEYLDNSSVAALVYRSDEHVINLFVWPTRGEVQDGSTLNTPQGYRLIHWSQGSLNYWAVSDVEATKLETFVQLFRAQASN